MTIVSASYLLCEISRIFKFCLCRLWFRIRVKTCSVHSKICVEKICACVDLVDILIICGYSCMQMVVDKHSKLNKQRGRDDLCPLKLNFCVEHFCLKVLHQFGVFGVAKRKNLDHPHSVEFLQMYKA